MRTRGAVVLAVVLSIPLLLVAQAAMAGVNDPMRIYDVRFMDLNDARHIEIVGTQFDNGFSPPFVTLDGVALTLTGTPTATSIEAFLPRRTGNGDYTIAVSTGSGNKQNAERELRVRDLVAMSVVCVDWFFSGPRDEHIHTEAHVEDQFGNPVIGAVVTWEAAYDGFVYQTNTSSSRDIDGKAHGAGCIAPTGSGVTDWFCCIGAGKWDGEIPGRRSCPSGFYSGRVLSVDPPVGTSLVWDGVTPENGLQHDTTGNNSN